MVSGDQARFISSLFASIPLSLLIRKLPTKLARQLYCLILGTLIQYFIYGIEIWLVLIQNVIVYLLVFITRKKAGVVVTAYSLFFLCSYHLYRMITEYGIWKLQISILLMANVCKYSLFAFAYQDGAALQQTLSQQQRKNRVLNLPNLFQFITFCQFLPTAVTGTAFQFSHYQDYINLKEPYKSIKVDLLLIGKTILESLIYAAVHLFSLEFFPMPFMKTSQFLAKPYWYVITYAFISFSLMKFKYYFGFKMSMCPIHASTVSYDKDSKKFNKINTCNPIKVELSMHFRDKIGNWNISCQQWLRKSIYQRLPMNKAKAGFVTFLVSAFWHGTYPGYYFTFFFWFFLVHLSTLGYKQCKKDSSLWKYLYNQLFPVSKIFIWLWTNLLLILNGGFFQLLEWQACVNYGKALYWGPSIIIYVALFLMLAFRGKSGRSKLIQKQREQTNKTSKVQSALNKVEQKVHKMYQAESLQQKKREQKDAKIYQSL